MQWDNFTILSLIANFDFSNSSSLFYRQEEKYFNQIFSSQYNTASIVHCPQRVSLAAFLLDQQRGESDVKHVAGNQSAGVQNQITIRRGGDQIAEQALEWILPLSLRCA